LHCQSATYRVFGDKRRFSESVKCRFEVSKAASARTQDLDDPPMTQRCFPPPWTVEELDTCFVVKDSKGQKKVRGRFWLTGPNTT
jgi:hypothetical protein